MVNVAAIYGTLDEASVHEEWVTQFAAALRQSDEGAYVNFVGDEGEAGVRAAYPGDDVGPPRGDQAPVRPEQPLPAQPEHPAGALTPAGRRGTLAR